MEISWFLVAILVIGVIALFFSRIAGRGGSSKNRYNRSEMGSPGFMFVDSNSGYSGGGEGYESDEDDDGDDGEWDDSDTDSPDYDDGGSYDSGGDSYDSGSDSSSSSSDY